VSLYLASFVLFVDFFPLFPLTLPTIAFLLWKAYMNSDSDKVFLRELNPVVQFTSYIDWAGYIATLSFKVLFKTLLNSVFWGKTAKKMHKDVLSKLYFFDISGYY
jgi:hypothetical protein